MQSSIFITRYFYSDMNIKDINVGSSESKYFLRPLSLNGLRASSFSNISLNIARVPNNGESKFQMVFRRLRVNQRIIFLKYYAESSTNLHKLCLYIYIYIYIIYIYIYEEYVG